MKKRLKWIITGYEIVSEKGFKGLNVELLANRMSSSKSSFYHYFGNIEEFKTELFNHHQQKVEELSQKIKESKSLIPDLVNIFIHDRVDILFHKQIRIYREDKVFRECFEKAYEIIEHSILEKWINHLKLQNRPLFAKSLLSLVSDNFLLRITNQNFIHSWLEDYIKELSYLVNQMKSSDKS
jgi:AcrR family transcriptional regulator